jgi:hypothetical protein
MVVTELGTATAVANPLHGTLGRPYACVVEDRSDIHDVELASP